MRSKAPQGPPLRPALSNTRALVAKGIRPEPTERHLMWAKSSVIAPTPLGGAFGRDSSPDGRGRVCDELGPDCKGSN